MATFHKQRGLTLVEMFFALLIAGSLTVSGVLAMQYLNRSNTSSNLASGLQQSYGAISAYVTKYYSQLVSGQPVCADGSTTTCAANPLAPTTAELKALGVAPQYLPANAYTGGAWKYAVQLTPAGCTPDTCNVTWAAYLSQPPLTRNNQPDVALLGSAAQKSGVQAGYSNVSTPSTISGLGGKWSVANPAGAVAGTLLAEGAFNSSQFATYLPRSGVLPMTGNLDMGGHAINNASTVAATTSVTVGNSSFGTDQGGSLELGGNNSTAGSGTPYIDFHLNGAGVQDFNARLVNDSDSNLSIQGANGKGSLSVQGNVGTYGFSPTSGYPTGWSGGVHTWDVYAEGSLGAGTAGSLNAYMNNSGNAFFKNNLQVGDASGTGAVSFSTNVSAVKGAACSPNGTLAASADGTGTLLSCLSGVWVPSGLPLQTLNSYCSTPGAIAQDSNGSAMICSDSVWTSLQSRIGNWIFQNTSVVRDGGFISNPVCPGAGTPKIILIPAGIQMDATNSITYSLSNVAGGAVAHITNSNGTPYAGATAIYEQYCVY